MSPPVRRVFLCEYIRVYMWKNRHLGDARRSAPFSSLSDLLRAFSHGSPHGSLRGSNASRQSVFYCVHAQEASIINLTGGISRSTSLCLRPPLSFGSLSLPSHPGSLWISHQKGTARRETAFILSRMSFISANRPRTTVFDSQRVMLNYQKKV